MSYTSLYRKYRSQSFDDVLGQRHITQTLRNAVSVGHVAHAYLFTGPRGSGKTSTARILAKAMNCLATDGPNPDPCGKCDACARIRDGNSLDVMEIDAASTRGIDDMRELRERVKYSPAEERFKVYIVDEVHQLTGEAFNAFLKTLEEPPSSVVFILATTELHKVPATILSRCQRFDFRRGALNDIRERIETVCEAEAWSITPEAVTALAVGANGGYRDALTLLEQVAAYTTGSGAITIEDVNVVLGNLADEQLLAAVDAISKRDIAACFSVVNEALATGVEVRQFIIGLRERLRDLLMIAVGALPDNSVIVASQREHIEEQARSLSQSDLLWCIDCLNQAEHDLRWSPQQRLLLETTLLKLASRSDAKTEPTREPVAVAEPVHRPARTAPPPAPAAPVQRPPAKPVVSAVTPAARTPATLFAAPLLVDETSLAELYRPTADDLDGLSTAWGVMVSRLKGSSRQSMISLLPLRVEHGAFVLGGPDLVWVEMAVVKREKVEGFFANAYGRRVTLRFIHDTGVTPPRARDSAAPGASYTQASLADLAAGVLDAEVVDPESAGRPNPFSG